MRSNILASSGIQAGILCCWSASGAIGMSGSYDWNWSFYGDVATPVRTKFVTVFPLPNEKVETASKGSLVFTTPFFTIMDLVRWDCEAEFVLNALAFWEARHGNLDAIWKGLEERGLMEKYLIEYEPYRAEWKEVY